MIIPLNYLIQIKYPTIDMNDLTQIQIVDHGLGNGPEIGVWNVNGVPQPQSSDLASYQADINVQAAYQVILNTQLNEPLIAQLTALDLKGIRPVMENDTALITSLNTQKAAIRAQLLPTVLSTVLASMQSSQGAS